MRYLLDSETVSSFYNEADKHYEAINSKIVSLSDDDEVYISVLTLYELEYGRANAPKELLSMLQTRVQRAQSDFIVLPVAPEGAGIFGDLKKALRVYWGLKQEDESKKKQMKQHNIDLILVSTVITKNAILVSTDKHYETITKLNTKFQYENWTL